MMVYKRTMKSIEHHMEMALQLAAQAASEGEVPVGAVVVLERDPKTGEDLPETQVVGRGSNVREGSQNPVGHAELLAIGEASKTLGRWRLLGCTLYVTLEPCVMCAGALVLSRVDKVVYGATDPKAGAVESLYQVLSDKRLNHRPEIISGVLGERCAEILKNFFLTKRKSSQGTL